MTVSSNLLFFNNLQHKNKSRTHEKKETKRKSNIKDRFLPFLLLNFKFMISFRMFHSNLLAPVNAFKT